MTIYGNLQVIGGAKNAIVPHPDGSHRSVYTVESPESYFEDFGQGELVNGRAEVRLDADFGLSYTATTTRCSSPPKAIHRACISRPRRRRGSASREQQGGQSNLRFAYRIVARRKDIDLARFDKVSLAPSPDPSRFLEAPPTPGAKRA